MLVIEKKSKYINFTDTEIDDMINNFSNMLCLIEQDIFFNYLQLYHQLDLFKVHYNKTELLLFISTIVDYINKKECKLRVRTDLKINKNNIFLNIFNCKFNITESCQYYIKLLFDFYFDQYELYHYIDNMEDYYIMMYDEYLLTYDKSLN